MFSSAAASMNTQKLCSIVAVVPTFFTNTPDDAVRLSLALRMLAQAKQLGVVVLCVDGSPQPSVATRLKDAGAVVVPETRSLDPNRRGKGFALRQGIQSAVPLLKAGDACICFLEPEKIDFVRSIPSLASLILQGEAEIVLPARTAAGFQSLPVEQQYSERFGNSHLQNLASEMQFPHKASKELSIDWLFGPVLFHSRLAKYWLEYDGRLWDAQIIPYIRAVQQDSSVRLRSVNVEYTYPPEQTSAEQHQSRWSSKRLAQLSFLLPEVEKALQGVADEKQIQAPQPILHAEALAEALTLTVPSKAIALRPRSFFVAWNGVMTLAFSGFPQALTIAKQTVTERFRLKSENFGSRWPKTTLGALKDGVTLSLDQLTLLKRICEKHEERVQQSTWRLIPSHLSAVLFECRSLERLLMRLDLPIGTGTVDTGNERKTDESDKGVDPVADSEKARVESVLKEFPADRDGLAEYHNKVTQPGNREEHYRGHHVESTLVAFWSSSSHVDGHGNSDPVFVEDFRREVDERLPGCYVWFKPDSLHVTLRALQ